MKRTGKRARNLAREEVEEEGEGKERRGQQSQDNSYEGRVAAAGDGGGYEV